MSAHANLKIKVQILCGDEIAMGPGKADLLEAIEQHGSISAAGRALGMSYRRAWLLVDAMNRCWREPLVSTSPGAGQGASVTAFGLEILGRYRSIQKLAARPGKAADWDKLESLMLAKPRVSRNEA